ncbi:MAG: zinc-binding alcohol dehydrogenase family protein [Planctomycetota bacterium]|nr:MAG: zinc-binding alcohol dehydrogenase family protein [Planctomycetota bacterium]
MRAMILDACNKPLKMVDLPAPKAGPNEVIIQVLACGVCRTDLHVFEGDLPNPSLPLILGHEIVGKVLEKGEKVKSFEIGDFVGVPWLGEACGSCKFCLKGQENLCDEPKFTGYTKNGGFCEITVAHQDFIFHLPHNQDPIHLAPLLCAGLIGFRSFCMVGEAQKIGLYGFGAAAHILAQILASLGRKFYAFTKPGDSKAQDFARSLGAEWAGGSDEPSPEPLEAAILFAPVGSLVPKALKDVEKGGIVVCGGIHMSPIPSFPYEILWGERRIQSVANLTREDGEEFFRILQKHPVKTHPHPYPLSQANQALEDLKKGAFEGAAVLLVTE